MEKGEALLLQRQLTRRFGTLPSDIVGRIAGATAVQLEQWGDRVLDAPSLAEVFPSLKAWRRRCERPSTHCEQVISVGL